jgi:hypothetical protein
VKWTWLDELVHNILAIGIVGPTVVILTARAFSPDVYVPPELLAASVAVLAVYGYKIVKLNDTSPTSLDGTAIIAPSNKTDTRGTKT